MKPNGPEANSPKRFPTTRWSLVAQAGLEDPENRREALDHLLSRYWPALHAHLVGDKRLPSEEAEDVLQEFIVGKILEKELIGQARQDLGKFRTFLLAALDRFVIDQFRRRNAKKHSPDGGAAMVLDLGDHAGRLPASPAPCDAFDTAWARGVLAETIDRMREECEASERLDLWGVFECRILGPILEGAEPVDYDVLVKRFHLQSPSQASNVLMTAKRMFSRVLRGVVAEYSQDSENIEAEIRDLREILGRIS